MKKIFFISFLFPIIGIAQIDSNINTFSKASNINNLDISSLVKKYKKILKNKDGVDAWRLQVKFTSKRDDIMPYKIKFINLYPEIPVYITFDSPYYKLTAGNFKTKHEALKSKNKIRKNFPGAHPISIILDPEFLK